jgi:hypothetical protein
MPCATASNAGRNEIHRFFDLAMTDVFGTELEPDEKDGMYLD